MAHTIKFKRKKSEGYSGVTLQPGEPIYNMARNHLLIGSTDAAGNPEDPKTLYHLTHLEMYHKNYGAEGQDPIPDNVVSFRIGGPKSDSVYTKTINNVPHASRSSCLSLLDYFYGDTDPDTRLANLMNRSDYEHNLEYVMLNNAPLGCVYIQIEE